MRMVDLIEKKKEGLALSREEIRYIVQGYARDSIPDYQMSAWAMAVYFQGMNSQETAELTEAMVESGEQFDLSGIAGRVVDKHSTGGVGDKTTLLIGPMVAACGLPVAKMSGRGLGHTGGTIDKLSSIPGFRVELSREDFIAQVNKIGLAVVAQSGNLVPADKKLYALRDVTATVDSIPLIASSVMSKKIAAGAQGIVLDVKYGSGAFMSTLERSRELACQMVAIGKSLGRETVAVISDMNQPLGRAVGNSLEVLEVINVLQGKGEKDLVAVSLELGAWMLVIGNKASGVAEGKQLLQKSLTSGAAWQKFLQFISAQGGDVQAVSNRSLALGTFQLALRAEESGYLQNIDARRVGMLSVVLGAGRETKQSVIDLGAGLVFGKKSGEWVETGEEILRLYSGSQEKMAEGRLLAQKIIQVGCEPPRLAELIQEVIT
ncbi:MAG TPA: pyrimidine-nucleoside phosphorylase [Desulfitobacteriaceae bacterium]|nr:pyrimidine-nucleoside phosphorylase [Desulfitobacteriaceae bacterium]